MENELHAAWRCMVQQLLVQVIIKNKGGHKSSYSPRAKNAYKGFPFFMNFFLKLHSIKIVNNFSLVDIASSDIIVGNCRLVFISMPY